MTLQDHKELLKLIPDYAQRIYVERGPGAYYWIRPDELKSTDIIQLKQDKKTPMYMKKDPGRKSAGSSSKLTLGADTEYIGKIMEKRAQSVAEDPLFQAIREDPTSEKSFGEIASAIAETAAIFKFERTEAERMGLEANKMSTLLNRQVTTLKTLADTVLKNRDQMRKDSIDLDGVIFQYVFQYMIDTFVSCMKKSGVREEMIGVVMDEWGDRLENKWKETLKAELKKL